MAPAKGIERLRNIGIVAHVDAGKTTTTERILYFSGRTHKIGEVDEGTTVTDWMDQERERGITITAAAVTTYWKDHAINIIDTPGHIDFTVEVERSLCVLDGVVVVFCGVGGVEPQSEKVWRQANAHNLPRIAYINKLDRTGADFSRVLEDVRARLSKEAIAVQIPVGTEGDFKAIINIIDEQIYTWTESETGIAIHTSSELSTDQHNEVQHYREALIEKLAEHDDEFLQRYMDGESFTPHDIRQALRSACVAGKIFPVLCGSSMRNKGIEPLLDAIVQYFPSPLEAHMPVATDCKTNAAYSLVAENSALPVLYAFKVMCDTESRVMTFARIYAGSVTKGMSLYNTSKECFERVDRLVRTIGSKKDNLDEAFAGDIVGIMGFKKTTTGDTLCEKKQPVRLPLFEAMEPIVSIAIEPKSLQDQDKLAEALDMLAYEDPSFKTKVDAETGQTIISGMGELHLEIITDRLKRFFKVDVRVGKPQVSYRESVSDSATVRKEINRQEGAKSYFGAITLSVAPTSRGEGFTCSAAKVAPALQQFVPAIQAALRGSLLGGIRYGYPTIDVAVTINSIEAKDGETNDVVLRMAAVEAFSQACLQAEPILLEPIMSAEISVPKEYLGGVVEDLSARHGGVRNIEMVGDMQAISAYVPLSKTFGYSNDIRSISQGRASYSLLVDHYDVVASNPFG